MGARIYVQSGIASGTVHWIGRHVTRIGSDPAMDLTIPSERLAKHALTLEYREGTYRIHNRSSGPIYLGGRTVESGASDTWMDADLLELADSVRLAMEWDNDPAPSAKPADRAGGAAVIGPESDAAERHDAPVAVDKRSTRVASASAVPASGIDRAKSSQTLTQIAVIVACVVGGILLLVRDQNAGSSQQVNLPSFAKIVSQTR